MNPALAFLILGGFAEPAIQVKMEVRNASQVIGYMEYGRVVGEDGGLTEKTIVTELTEKGKVFVVDIARYDSKGRPIDLHRKVRSGERLHEMKIEYTEEGAKVGLVMASDLSMTDMRPRPDEAVMDCAARFWFLRDKPARGAICTSWLFDPDDQLWLQKRWVYEEAGQTLVDGKLTKGHRLTLDSRDTLWVDDAGLPLKMTLTIEQRLVEVVRVQIVESRL